MMCAREGAGPVEEPVLVPEQSGGPHDGRMWELGAHSLLAEGLGSAPLRLGLTQRGFAAEVRNRGAQNKKATRFCDSQRSDIE